MIFCFCTSLSTENVTKFCKVPTKATHCLLCGLQAESAIALRIEAGTKTKRCMAARDHVEPRRLPRYPARTGTSPCGCSGTSSAELLRHPTSACPACLAHWCVSGSMSSVHVSLTSAVRNLIDCVHQTSTGNRKSKLQRRGLVAASMRCWSRSALAGMTMSRS